MDTSSLPLGWKTTTDDDRISTAIILVLSLVLAVIMAFFIIGCVTWRRKRLKMSEKDLEKKAKRSQELSEDESQEEPEEVRRMKSQQRMWSRATARWKANVRISARRRRGKRQAASLSTSHSSNSLPNLSILSVNQSRVTIASEPQEESEVDTTTEHHEDPPEDGPSSSGSSLEHSSSSTHPPAYHRSAHPVESVQQRSEFTGRSADDPSSEEHLPYVPPTDGVHVATDDKQMLSQLASLASAPPPSPTSPSLCPSTGTTSDVPLASVPPMEEVEENEIKLACLQNDSAGVWTCSSGSLEHISTSEECPPVPSYSQEHSLETIFPPPPSKGTFVSAPFYDHPTSFEVDIVGIEPVEGPSAPPFESIGPSAPPLDDVCFLDTIPSAPPIPLEGPDQGPSSDPRVSDDEVSTTLGVS